MYPAKMPEMAPLAPEVILPSVEFLWAQRKIRIEAVELGEFTRFEPQPQTSPASMDAVSMKLDCLKLNLADGAIHACSLSLASSGRSGVRKHLFIPPLILTSDFFKHVGMFGFQF